MDETTVKLTVRQQELLDQLRRCEESGLDMKAFAEREGLKVQDLYTAKGVLKRKGVFGESGRPRPRFARVQVDTPGETVSLCRVRFANGCCVEISCPSHPEAWRALLTTVAALR